MKKTILAATLLALMTLVPVQADPIFQFDANGGTLSAVAGTTVGWGVTVTPDPNSWVSIVFTTPIVETNPVGIYNDLFGTFGGPVDFAFQPGSTPYTGPFNLINGTGLGSYTIDSNAAPGTTDQITIRIGYELYSADPLTAQAVDLGFQYQDLSGSILLPGQLPSPTPEPATISMLATGVGMLALGVRKRAAMGK